MRASGAHVARSGRPLGRPRARVARAWDPQRGSGVIKMTRDPFWGPSENFFRLRRKKFSRASEKFFRLRRKNFRSRVLCFAKNGHSEKKIFRAAKQALLREKFFSLRFRWLLLLLYLFF